eukprot:1142151-Pelagomonas_calceolata.AAC.1
MSTCKLYIRCDVSLTSSLTSAHHACDVSLRSSHLAHASRHAQVKRMQVILPVLTCKQANASEEDAMNPGLSLRGKTI